MPQCLGAEPPTSCGCKSILTYNQLIESQRAAHSVEVYRSSSFAARKVLRGALVRSKIENHLYKTGGLNFTTLNIFLPAPNTFCGS